MPIGRVTQVVDCREAMGMGKGGGIAQRGTISECRYPDVIVVGMSPGRRHVTKPVCDITSGLRQQGVELRLQVSRVERELDVLVHVLHDLGFLGLQDRFRLFIQFHQERDQTAGS